MSAKKLYIGLSLWFGLVLVAFYLFPIANGMIADFYADAETRRTNKYIHDGCIRKDRSYADSIHDWQRWQCDNLEIKQLVRKA